MSTLECLSCAKEYDAKESNATTVYMFCSQSCEDIENQRLAEGNEIVRKAQEENPQIMQQTEEVNLKNADISTLLKFVKGEQNK